MNTIKELLLGLSRGVVQLLISEEAFTSLVLTALLEVLSTGSDPHGDGRLRKHLQEENGQVCVCGRSPWRP